MGFSTVAAEAIFFIVVVVAVVTLAGIFNNYFDTMKDAVQTQTRHSESKLSTSMVVSDITASQTDINATARNVGETTLDVNKIDVFVDGIFIDRSDVNIAVIQSTDTKNTGLWDPYERIMINAKVDIDSNTTYDFKIESENGVTATRKFSAS